MYFNSKGEEQITYDAIVIGSGISGGWAAKELCEKGLKVLMLERGRMIKHIDDYETANLEKWELPNRNRMTLKELEDYPVQNRTGYTVTPATKKWWVKDTEHPYTEEKPFDWIRGYHLGGRSLLWGRQSYRWSAMDFEANAKDGVAVDWPIRYKDLEKWYHYVEGFAGISGRKEGLAQLPDGNFLPPMGLTCVEEDLREKLFKHYKGRVLTIGRAAHLTKAIHGRGSCQFRNRCMRGCPFGGYFSSQASTLPAAERTGNLTIRPHSIVDSIIYDDTTEKAKGVSVIDAETKETLEFHAKIIFCNASTLGSTSILMNSKSERFPDGMGNDSGELGHNLMDHHFKVGARSTVEGFEDKYYKGKRPNGIYMPRFRNIDKESTMSDFIRGYGYQGGSGRYGYFQSAEDKFGAKFKANLGQPGSWTFNFSGFGEMLPYHENKVSLNYEKLDKWGLPTLSIDCEIKENELRMREDMKTAAAEMLETCGLKDVSEWEYPYNPGNGIHEMGTARMGKDPKTSVLNAFNQIHAVKNVFVTDGACMTSAACQNPSLTYMALTARACDHAVNELKKNNL